MPKIWLRLEWHVFYSQYIWCMCRRSGLYIRQHYGSGSGPIWLGDVDCTGNEMSLAECPHTGWGVHSCNYGYRYDVSIICGESKCRQPSSHCCCDNSLLFFFLLLCFHDPLSSWWAIMNRLHSTLSAVSSATPLTSLLQHFRISSVRQVWPNSWSFLFHIVSTVVSSWCTVITVWTVVPTVLTATFNSYGDR